MIRARLNLKQYEAVTASEKLVMFIGGIGSGKSTVGGYWTRDKFLVPGSLGLIVAATADQLKMATMPAIRGAWEELGIREGEHYVIDRRPPRSWKVKPYTYNCQGIVTFRWGAYIRLGSVENYGPLRGPEYDWILGDEWREWKEAALPILNGRLRGKAFKHLGKKYQILLLTSPPDNPQRVRKHFKGDYRIVRASSYDNEANLPPDYINDLLERYDPLTFDREVLGLLLSNNGLPAYYRYDEGAHSQMLFRPDREVFTAWDFNTGIKPMSCILLQRDDQGRVHAVKEFVRPNSNTESISRELAAFLRENDYAYQDKEDRPGQNGPRVNLTGDYAGGRKSSNTSKSDWVIIGDILREDGYYVPTEKTRATYRVKDRVDCTNALIQSTAGNRGLFVNPQTCPALHADLQLTVWKKGGNFELDDSDPERTHPSDALSYYAYNYHPLKGQKPPTQ